MFPIIRCPRSYGLDHVSLSWGPVREEHVEAEGDLLEAGHTQRPQLVPQLGHLGLANEGGQLGGPGLVPGEHAAQVQLGHARNVLMQDL